MGRTGDPPATAAARGSTALKRGLFLGATMVVALAAAPFAAAATFTVTTSLRRVILLCAASLAALTAAPFAGAATFTVTTTADTGAGSLRQAILDANAAAGPDTIQFSVAPAARSDPAGVGPPAGTEEVMIDGSAEPGGSGSPIVALDGGPRRALRATGLDLQPVRVHRSAVSPGARDHSLGHSATGPACARRREPHVDRLRQLDRPRRDRHAAGNTPASRRGLDIGHHDRRSRRQATRNVVSGNSSALAFPAHARARACRQLDRRRARRYSGRG